MTKEEIFKKVEDYLDSDLYSSKRCCQEIIGTLAEAATKFRSSNPNECCLSTMRALLFFIEDSSNKDYIVSKNALFGDLSEIRKNGFERRYMSNIKITKTYIKAYQKTEQEYIETFGKRRYASYDSFRNVRNRYIKKK
tara:strand:- start:357 stop:770 length:414 start_codon:yes stop_codon:yes gene_type:complete